MDRTYFTRPFRLPLGGPINILPDTSKSQGNKTMKVGQLIEYSMKNIFLQKSYGKLGRDLKKLYIT